MDISKSLSSIIKRITSTPTIKETLDDTQKSKLTQIDKFISDLYAFRKEGLEKDGEYGLDNQVFKKFRNMGYLKNLKNLKNELLNKEMCLESSINKVDLDESLELGEDGMRKALKEFNDYMGYRLNHLHFPILYGDRLDRAPGYKVLEYFFDVKAFLEDCKVKDPKWIKLFDLYED